MKTFRILAIIPLALISLMNVGYPFGTEPRPAFLASIAACVLGLAGLGAVVGLARNSTWGPPAAVAVAGVNVLAALLAMFADAEGAVIGLVVSSIALVLSLAATSWRRAAAVA